MLDRTDFASWQQRIRLYCRVKENGVNILKSIDEGPFQMGTIRDPIAEGTEGAQQLGCIENGNSFKPTTQTTTNADGTSTLLIPGPYKDAKTLFAAIQTRFGANEATKKTQKTLLKQITDNTQVSPASTQVSTTSTQVSTANLSDVTVYAFLARKTPYELLRGRKPTLDYFRVFGNKFFILNIKDYLTKFDPKSYEGIFLGYSQNSKAYIILNKHTRKVEESLNVTFNETPPPSKTSPLVDDDLDEEEAIKVTEKKNLKNDIKDETLEIDEIVNIKESRNHPLENVIGNLNQRTLRSQAQNQSNFFCFISTIEPKNVNEALTDDSWIVAMQEELNQFIANDIWELVPQPRNMKIIGTKWVFRNKLDENEIVS
ncbi:retrovirus-related pol polyprotein from transposon TNT 1-94 [Tanacetum coccineum]